MFLLYSFAPIVWLITCNIILFKQLSQRNMKKQSGRKVDTEGRRERRDMKSLTKMRIVVCVVFIAVTVPTCINHINAPYVFARTSPHDVAKRLLAWAIVAFFLHCNNTFNFIIYCISGSLFRKELHGLLVQIKVFLWKCFNRRIYPAHNFNESIEETKAGPSMMDHSCTIPTADSTNLFTDKHKNKDTKNSSM